MKRIAIITMITLAMLISAGNLFAAGAQEDGTVQVNPWGETVTVSGKVYASFTGHPELIAANGTTYELMFPMFLAEGLELSNGETITVEGAEIPGGYGVRRADSDETYLRVIKATVDGKTYDLSETFGRGGPGGYGGMMGPRGGMMGGQGGWNQSGPMGGSTGMRGGAPGRGGFQSR